MRTSGLTVALCSLVLFSGCAEDRGRPQIASHAVQSPVVDNDIGRFWHAFDAINATSDPAERLRQIQTVYIDRGTPGLPALMAARRYTAQQYVDAIDKWPKFWASVRPLTTRSQQAVGTLNGDVARFRRLYPDLRPATITYAIGVLRTGGTTVGNQVLIGAELALGDETVDVSELPEPLRTRLGTFFKSRPFENNAQNNIHEYVHTQQQETEGSLAQQALREGVAELVAELITGRKPALPVYSYGPANEAVIKARFMAEMAGDDYANWLWNSASNPFGVSDVGYFVGYRIAQKYYDAAYDKRRAVKTLIELPYNDPAAIRAFVDRTGYLQGIR
ncbi:hypothetical protein [uncultured Sphingomonas sp.]|uniref:hypothetical protein n=1 Tax=uncultured Sphingomonas sp. TaxID=158754 RepID=UPI0025F88114|nr:hypothetical protein [uncultured Sphingomonas sp.]